ncbi:cytochrome c [Piscinibacter sp. HJYY11]|uniref:SorU family sulfite dehydrogenase c-type cytochrome subunit n=1 Tax=Piscinibacter sp. HJYY11 TaxID=2801333 RepID=UPI00191F3012|nr:cytochrome c [Piscinibacter sp. HJYY11]MBL0731168.1 cytochrome c [Piscinibacter sp. HJYY11]
MNTALHCIAAAALAASSLAVQADEREAGRKLFTSGTAPSCAVCHSLRDAQASGEIGPPLDELKPDEARVSQALRNGLGVMPSFRDKLSEKDLALLARYVAQVAGR